MRVLASLFLILLSSLFGLAGQAQEVAPNYGFEIVNSYPHDINSFTQGLFYHDGYLYEGTGKRGLSTLSKLDLESAEVLQSKRLGRRYFGEGIELVGNRIYQLTWQSHLVFVHDLETFESLGTHYIATEGWGLAYDGKELILSDGSDQLQFIDPETFAPTRKVKVTLNGDPINYINELEYIDGEVWANIWQTDYIVRINPDNGVVNSWIDLTGLSGQTRQGSAEAMPNGIAWDDENKRLFVTGKHWANLFEIKLVDP